MFVASHFESGHQAVSAVLSHFIGSIHTAIGYGTLRRAAGGAVQVKAGDPVCQGDVIETAADGQIGICLIDGTVFVLSHDTCVVLDGFVCDLNSVSQSASFAVDRGTFAFIPGHMAKCGSPRIDTPVGSIRGRANAGGFGMLSLTALTFATISDVKAADPDATFLDDDDIAYKDLEHGKFELWTKEAVPRHIIVEDPGETIVLTKRGSSVQRELSLQIPRLAWRNCKQPSRPCWPVPREAMDRAGPAPPIITISRSCNQSTMSSPVARSRRFASAAAAASKPDNNRAVQSTPAATQAADVECCDRPNCDRHGGARPLHHVGWKFRSKQFPGGCHAELRHQRRQRRQRCGERRHIQYFEAGPLRHTVP